QGCAAILLVLGLDRRASLEQQLRRIGMAAVGRPMQAALSVMLQLRAQLHALLQEKSDDAGSPELTGPGEAVVQLFLRRGALETAIFLEETLDNVEAADAGGSFQIETRALAGEEFRRLAAAVVQAAVH